MYSRKPMTILTSRIENKKVASKLTRRAFTDVREAEMTSPASECRNMYVSIGGIITPISK